jgi:CCR4-NOT transcription complex subunit 7/8
MGSFRGKSDYHYQCLRCNVDLLKIIQLGITLFTEDGEQPPSTSQSSDSGIDNQAYRKYNGSGQLPCTWQFNFKFSLKDDMYAEVSIDALKQAGVDFARLDVDGIDPFDFASLLISSGLVCDEDVRWISFHGGYDFGYLTKLLICQPLPDDEMEFDMLMKKFFPSIYDIKYLMKYAIKQHTMGQLTPIDPGSADILAKFEQKASLENIAESFKVKRQGSAHQAGSDSCLTGRVFFRMRERIFNGEISDDHLGAVWGLNLPDHSTAPHLSTPQHFNQQLQENTTPGQNGNGFSNGPTTPSTGNVGLASTPGNNNNGGAIGPLTPGGGGGVFGSFQFGGSR